MAVTCGNCGEELLGAVNRCWRCGQVALSTPDAASAPPIRRAPIGFDVGQVPRRKTVSSDEDVFAAALVTDEEASGPLPCDSRDDPPAAADDRYGASSLVSPMASSASLPSIFEELPNVTQTQVPTIAARHVHESWQSWLAIGSVVLGLLSIGCGWMTAWMVLLAAAGLACGILGTQSRRQATAILGLLLCLLGITASSVRLAYDTFIFIRGEPPIPMNADPQDDSLAPLDSMEPFDAMEPLE